MFAKAAVQDLRANRAFSRTSNATRLRRLRISAAGPVTQQPLALHVGKTTINLPFDPTELEKLETQIGALLQTFLAKQKATRPQRWEPMTYIYKAESSITDLNYLEVFCNPNAYTTAFDASLLITIKAKGGFEVTTEAGLSAFKSDLETYRRQVA